jgi:energy-coupling factor transporter ATP-binding protein EcfA2
MLRVKRIHIHNVLGIEDIEIRPGKLVLVQGRNGAGKTSVLEAIRHALRGGKDATLIRRGETFGSTVIEFDDETELQRRYYADGSDSLDVTHPFLDITGAKTWAKKLLHPLSVNPVDFITQPTKRAAWMLEANPVPVDEIGEALALLEEDDGRPTLGPGEAESHALPVLNRLEKKLFDDRAEVNRTLRDKEGTAKQFEETLPPAPPEGDWQSRADAIEAEQKAVAATKLERLRAVDAEHAEAERREGARHAAVELEAEKVRAAAVAQLEADARAKVEEIKRQLTADKDGVTSDHKAAVDASKTERDNAVTAAATERDIRRDEIAQEYRRQEENHIADLAVARERAKAGDRLAQAKANLEFMLDSVGEMKDRAGRFTKALEAIRELKRRACENLPIPDAEVVEGEIVVGGVPYDRLPQSRQIRIAVDIAALSAGELGLICVDGLEHLDSTSWPEFTKAAEEKGLQMIVARVADSDLTVTVDPLESMA